MDSPSATTKTALIKNIYLYLICFVALMMVTISVGDMIQIALKKYVFTKADKDFYYSEIDCEMNGLIKGPRPVAMPDNTAAKPPTKEECAEREARAKKQAEENRAAQRQRDLVRDISFVLVGVPLFAYHWRVARKKGE